MRKSIWLEGRRKYWLSAVSLIVISVILFVAGLPADRRSNELYGHPSQMVQDFLFYPAIALLVIGILWIIGLLVIRNDNSSKPGASNANISAVEMDVSKIRNAGVSAEVLGWLLLLVAGIFIYNMPPSGYFFYSLAGGIYFVCAGKYISHSIGSNVKGILLSNGLIAIPYCTGIIPIIICIQSFVNYSRFKKLPTKAQKILSTPKPYKIQLHDIILGIIVIVLYIGMFYLGYQLRRSDSPSYPSVSSQSSLYTAAKYNFTISFPGSPTATDSSSKVSGYTVPYTTYDSSINNDTQEFDVSAYAWPTQDFNFGGLSQSSLQTSISGSLKGIISGLKGTIQTSNETPFSGYSAMEAQFTATISSSTVTGHVRVFFVGDNEYAIDSLGASKADFENFANSFRYSGN